MNDAERIRQHHGGPHLEGHPPQGPYWKRMHRSPFFWVALVAMLLAMGIFVATDCFVFRPRIIAMPAPAGNTP